GLKRARREECQSVLLHHPPLFEPKMFDRQFQGLNRSYSDRRDPDLSAWRLNDYFTTPSRRRAGVREGLANPYGDLVEPILKPYSEALCPPRGGGATYHCSPNP